MIPGRVVKSKARKACVFIFKKSCILTRIFWKLVKQKGETKHVATGYLGFIKQTGFIMDHPSCSKSPKPLKLPSSQNYGNLWGAHQCHTPKK